jgi:hypothetical protein
MNVTQQLRQGLARFKGERYYLLHLSEHHPTAHVVMDGTIEARAICGTLFAPETGPVAQAGARLCDRCRGRLWGMNYPI